MEKINDINNIVEVSSVTEYIIEFYYMNRIKLIQLTEPEKSDNELVNHINAGYMERTMDCETFFKNLYPANTDGKGNGYIIRNIVCTNTDDKSIFDFYYYNFYYDKLNGELRYELCKDSYHLRYNAFKYLDLFNMFYNYTMEFNCDNKKDNEKKIIEKIMDTKKYKDVKTETLRLIKMVIDKQKIDFSSINQEEFLGYANSNEEHVRDYIRRNLKYYNAYELSFAICEVGPLFAGFILAFGDPVKGFSLMLSPFVLLYIQVEIEKMIDKSIVQKVANELYYLNKPEEIKEEVFRKVL